MSIVLESFSCPMENINGLLSAIQKDSSRTATTIRLPSFCLNSHITSLQKARLKTLEREDVDYTR